MFEIITPIIVCLVVVLTLTGVLLLAKSFLVSSGKVTITINGDKKLEVDGGSTPVSYTHLTLPTRDDV